MSPFPHPRAALVVGASAIVLLACGQWEPETVARDRAIAALDCNEVTLTKITDNRFRASGCGGVVEVLCTAAQNEPVCLVGRAREEGHVSGIADLGSGGEVSDDDDTTPTDAHDAPADDEIAALEARIRAGIDAHRDDVLACTGRSASVVRVRYAVDGAITLTLGGDLEGSPEEGCVRAAIGGVRVSPGHEGTVMHLVRRPASTPAAEPSPASSAPVADGAEEGGATPSTSDGTEAPR
ncbi:MAG: hypothetical protein U0353_02050 [Sandaracinus sp.]